MRRSFVAAIILVLLCGVPLPVPAGAQQKPVDTSEASSRRGEAIRKVLPSVVSITTRNDTVPGGAGTNAEGTNKRVTGAFGSGFVVDPSGVIATNYHVVKDAWDIHVTLQDGTWVKAQLLRASRLVDVALIKVDVGHPIPAVSWGDSEKLDVGQPVLAIGNALDVGTSVSGGLVSALNRNIHLSPYDDFVQTDAAINHGNSGGPLIDMNGDVVGIDTAIFSPTDSSSGVGFAISSRGARIIIDRLMQYGWLRPGWVGVKLQQVTPEMALALGMERAEGSVVAYVAPGGPVEKGGLRVGDVILQVGNVFPSDERALLRAIAETPIGREAMFGLLRNGQAQRLNVTVQEWPRDQWEKFDVPVSMAAARHRIAPDLGLTLAAAEGSGRAGVEVRRVTANTDAAERGVSEGDVILRVQERAVSSPADAQAAFKAARAEKRRYVMLLVDPKVHRLPGPEWVALRLAED